MFGGGVRDDREQAGADEQTERGTGIRLAQRTSPSTAFNIYSDETNVVMCLAMYLWIIFLVSRLTRFYFSP